MKNGFVKVRCLSPEIRVADVSFNTAKIIQAISDSSEKDVKILVLPELCVCGYTCADLFSQKTLIDACERAILSIKEATLGKETVVFLGSPIFNNGKLYNCAIAIQNGQILGVIPKKKLLNYSENYELRNFNIPDEALEDVIIGEKKYPFGTDLIFKCSSMKELSVRAELSMDESFENEATVIVNLDASSEIISKDDYRRLMCRARSASLTCAYLYSNASECESTTDSVFSAHNIICEDGIILVENEPFYKKDGDIITEIDASKIYSTRAKMNVVSNGAKPIGREIQFDLTVKKTNITRFIDPNPFVPSNEDEADRRCEKILTMQQRALSARISRSGAKSAVIGISGGLDSTLSLLATVRAFDYLKMDRKNIYAITMPCFGTTNRTKSNAITLCEKLGVSIEQIDIFDSVRVHFRDIKHDENMRNVTYENAQARERTQILMDYANDVGGLVVGTGDLSEIALGWSTYNADHMSMYNVNCSVPKTLVRHIVAYEAKRSEGEIKDVLEDIVATPVSPELLPPDGDDIAQKTESLVGPYDLHDFFLYNFVRCEFAPSKIYRLAKIAFDGVFDEDTIYKWLEVFIKRFFTQQFKRSCSPDGVKIGTVALSPRGDLKMPSDASSWVWLDELATNKE